MARGTSGPPAASRSRPPMPQWVSPVSVRSVGTPPTPAASASALISRMRDEALRRVGRADRFGRVEARTLRRARDLGVGGDVLALAEEGVVERVLERPETALLAGPEAGRQRQRRARLVARQMDLDAELERALVHVACPVDPEVVAARLRATASAPAEARTGATRPRPSPRPRPPRPRATRGTSTGRRRRSRSAPSSPRESR